jgi:hypothetical protein
MFLLVDFKRVLDSRADDSLGANATIDHTDMRGSEPHGHDPSAWAKEPPGSSYSSAVTH